MDEQLAAPAEEADWDPDPPRLRNVVCPQCKKPFVLTWNDYQYQQDRDALRLNGGRNGTPAITLWIRSCPSGGTYSVSIGCPHCNYEEEL